ncbi:hypothetical protein MBLNU459_g6583t2 [Dothideomycetes sp. NU459]
MSGELSRQRSGSSKSRHEGKARPIPPHPTLTPENIDREFDPCAATGSYLLYAQRNVILCLHHDTLAIERRFDLHKEDILWISADTVSERGAGRLAVSYDTGNTAIVWDISTGREVATFTAYEPIRVAAWMRNGNIAFGNSQGNVVLFEPSTSEHISARTIYDPITAIAPATDNRTFAIGPPSRISGLAWHGSSSRQKSEMLATQTVDGDLRVWSIPKTPNGDSPNIIRVLNKPESKSSGPCWFAWSKNGRIVQHADGETRAWDVRTKTVTCENIPTVDGITGIANYGPTSTLFTLGRNHTVQQYDVNPTGKPLQVVTVQHAPANTPPSPPNSIEEKNIHKTPATAVLATAPAIPGYFDAESSEGEGFTMSPLQRIAHEMDQLEEERRDKVGALSPVSSRASSVSSKSSNGGKLAPSYRYDRASSSQASDVSYNDGTEFSFGQPSRHARESISIRSTSSYAPSKYRSSGLRNQVLRSPEETEQTMHMELFSFVKARLRDVPFRTPHYGHAARTPDVLRKEMLSVVFGWNHDIEELVRDEVSRHKPGSASCVLLSKWLGDLGADSMATMIGSESMSSSDWMLLALSSMGQDSQRQVGEAFVQRLLEKGDIHPAVAILLGLGEHNDAVEVYVSRAYYTEAVLLTCLIFPADWQRQSYLVRKMGELAMTSEPWFSPRAQDAVFTAQKEQFLGPALASPPLSPPSATGSSRMAFKNPPLKLITTFGDKGVPVLPSRGQATPMSNTLGVTPIAESALTPGGAASWLNNTHRKDRDPSSARTATPGAYNRKRFPTRSESAHTRDETPQTASRDFALPSKRLDTYLGSSADNTDSENNSSAALGLSARSDTVSPMSAIGTSRSIKGSALDPYMSSIEQAKLTAAAQRGDTRPRAESRNGRSRSRARETSEARGRTGMRYIKAGKRSPSSPVPMSPEEVSAAMRAAAVQRAENRSERKPSTVRATSRAGSKPPGRARSPSAQRLRANTRGRSQQRKIGSSARSPSSPLPMSPEAALQKDDDEVQSDGQRLRIRQRSTSQHSKEQLRSPVELGQQGQLGLRPSSKQRSTENAVSGLPLPRVSLDSNTESDDTGADQDKAAPSYPDKMIRKMLAARELEERRLSLARRPSAPQIPLPGAPLEKRPTMPPRYHTELGESPHSDMPPLSGGSPQRSRTVDPESVVRFMPARSGASTSASVGLPATPRAMKIPRYRDGETVDDGDIPAVPEVPDNLSQLASAVYQHSPDKENDYVADLLPSSVFGQRVPQPPPRSASAPLERSGLPSHPAYKAALPPSNRRASIGRGHARQLTPVEHHIPTQPQRSPPAVTASIDQALHDGHVVVVEQDAPIMLPELQHLAGPPPPPPPPLMFSGAPNINGSSLGVINIAIEEDSAMVIDVTPTLERAATSSPSAHRRGRGSVSEGIGSRLRNVTDRMRSRSGSRTMSPPMASEPYKPSPSPYESLPHITSRRESLSRAKSPYESSISSAAGSEVNMPPPSQGRGTPALSEQSIAPDGSSQPPSRTGSAFQGYRHPREVRANMPPETLQQGVYQPGNMI